MKRNSFHPLTWWIWCAAIAISVARVNSPLFATLSVGAVGVVVFIFRENAPWGKSFSWSLKLALWILIVRTMIGIEIGVPIPGRVLFSTPRIPLPNWMPGIRIGGAVTFERLSSAVSEGVIICAILIIFAAATSLTSPHRLLRTLPIFIYEFGVSVVIATSVVPQLVTSLGRIRQAQRLRGQKANGFKAYRRTAIPLLEEVLARALDLAAAMDSRGYGVKRNRSRYRPINWSLRDSLIIASGLIVVGLT